MHFRKKSVVDSTVERIMAVSESIRTDTPVPEGRGAATIALERQDNGDLLVTKSFENGEPEILTISNRAAPAGIPEGFVDVTPAAEENTQPGITGTDALGITGGAAPDQAGIVENAALGGDAITALLRT